MTEMLNEPMTNLNYSRTMGNLLLNSVQVPCQQDYALILLEYLEKAYEQLEEIARRDYIEVRRGPWMTDEGGRYL